MSVRDAKAESKPYVFNMKGADGDVAIYGIIANVQPNSQASSLSVDEWNQLLASGRVTIAPYVKTEKSFDEFRQAAGFDQE